MTVDLEKTTDFLRELLDQEARTSLDRWSSVGTVSFKDARDFASQVDLDIETSIKNTLRSRFPTHGLQGEETDEENAESPYQWLIDPIDGTKWYAARSSLFSISVALLHDGEPVLGVVHLPPSGQCFSAFAGGGALLDGQPLHGSQVDELSRVIVNVDTPATHRLPPDERAWFERTFVELSRRVYRVRALGVGSLAACWLATGALDAYIDLTGYVKPQDLAAGRIIMQESGIRLEYLSTPPGPPRLVAAPPAIWDALRGVLSR